MDRHSRPPPSQVPRIQLAPEHLRLLADLKAQLDELLPSSREGSDSEGSTYRSSSASRGSLDEALRVGLQRLLHEELSPFVREQVASAIRDGLGRLPSPPDGRTKLELLSVQDVARQCGVTVPTVRGWIRTGILPALNPGKGRLYRVRREDLVAFLERRPAASAGVTPEVDEQVARLLTQVRVRAKGEKD